MPKEYVDDTVGHLDKDSPFPFRVEVTWGRDNGFISIATVDPNVVGDAADTREAGLHVHLGERRDVNKLIRDLRRARDQAFGRDE